MLAVVDQLPGAVGGWGFHFFHATFPLLRGWQAKASATGVRTFPKPGGRKTLAHGVSRVEWRVRMGAPERGERLFSAPEVARIVCDAMLPQE